MLTVDNPQGILPSPPKGNKNALKHGLCAHHYSRSEQTALNQMLPLEFLSKIYMLCCTDDRNLSMIENHHHEDRKVRLFNSLLGGARSASLGGFELELN